MIGPIYLLEWQQAKRRAGRWPWRWIYVGVLLLEAALVGYEMTVRTWGQRDPLEFEAVMGLLLVWLHIQQLGIILLVAPAFAAGSITDEKRLGTLDFLLCAPLGSGEIIVSKWLAQATQTLHLVSPGVFFLAALSAMRGEPPERFVAVVILPIALTYALVAVAICSSCVSQNTTRAILLVYTLLTGLGMTEWLANRSIVWIPLWSSIWNFPSFTAQMQLLGMIALTTLLGLALSIWRLRPAYEHQRVAVSSTLGRWWDRPSIGETPMRWKERFVGDWLALPIWNRLPRGARYVLFAGAIIALGLAMPTLETFLVLGGLQFLLSGLFVAIRCAGSITSERERQTWDSLVLTRLDARQILRGKLWGQIDAVGPYLFTYLFASLPVAYRSDPWAVPWIISAWLGSWVFLYYFGTVGITCSSEASSTWRSIVVTLLKGFGTVLASQLTLGLSTASIFILTMFWLLPFGWANSYFLMVFVPIPGLLWLLALTEESMTKAELAMITNDKANRM